MSDTWGSRGASLVLGVCLFLAAGMCQGQAAGAIPADQAQAAVGLVTKLYTVNTLAKANANGNPLSKKGSWGVRMAQGDERIPACEVAGAACDEVVYRAGQPEIACTWTVLFPSGSGEAKVVSDNEASGAYMLRIFRDSDKDRPPLQKVPPLEAPPIAKVAHMRGTAVVNLVVDKTGKIVSTEIFRSSNPVFNNAALAAVGSWVMTPYLLNGQPRPYKEATELDFDPFM